ncbi:hypothetical protein BR93DRAFT_189484 [Coniochaeta sp. PMI_546]|nr:hypothetical protein BR93DRAFT_189484 [Coniochaeta sp. PMI_546]
MGHHPHVPQPVDGHQAYQPITACRNRKKCGHRRLKKPTPNKIRQARCKLAGTVAKTHRDVPTLPSTGVVIRSFARAGIVVGG